MSSVKIRDMTYNFTCVNRVYVAVLPPSSQGNIISTFLDITKLFKLQFWSNGTRGWVTLCWKGM